MNPANLNNEPRKDTTTGSAINGFLKVVSWLIKYFVERMVKKKEQADIRLADWKNSYIERQNKRVDRVELMRSAEKLADKNK